MLLKSFLPGNELGCIISPFTFPIFEQQFSE